MDCGSELQVDHVVYGGNHIRDQGPAQDARGQAGGLCRQPPNVSTRTVDKRRKRTGLGQGDGQQRTEYGADV